MAHLLKTLSNSPFKKFALLALLAVALMLPGAEAGLPKCNHSCKRNRNGQGRCKLNGYVYKCRLPGKSCACPHCKRWCPLFEPAPEDTLTESLGRPALPKQPAFPVIVNEDNTIESIYDYEDGPNYSDAAIRTDLPRGNDGDVATGAVSTGGISSYDAT